jgi:glycosyltransferase involved in cell wall biosynthesis
VTDALARTYRLACLVTHPIQYQAPLFRLIAADPDIRFKVFFASDFSARQFVDPEFGRPIAWDVPLLEGYEHEVLPCPPGLRYPGNTYFDGWRPFSTGLGRRLRQGRFDAIWIHGYARVPHILAMLAARICGVRVMLRDETSAIGRTGEVSKTSAKRILFALIDRMVDGYLTIGSMNEQHYRDLGIDPHKFFRMGYAVDNDWFRQRIAEARPRREALRAELGLPGARPVILFAAKLIHRKAPLDLVHAFARIFAEAPPDRQPVLVMAGDGDLRPAIEAAIAAHRLEPAVRLLGFQPQRRLAALYDLCDVFVLPSAHETWGLVVNEVMNAAKAVIASDRVGAARDLVRDGVNGFIYPLGDIAALASRLHEATADSARLAAMGSESLRIIDDWGFAQNLAALKAALAVTTGPA